MRPGGSIFCCRLRFYNRAMAQTFDICIRGAGIVGRALALLLARERLRVALVAPPRPADHPADVRAYALNTASQQLLDSLRAWPDALHATAIERMEVHGDGNSQVQFDARAQGQEALTWIVDVPALEQRLAEAVRYQPLIEVVAAPVAAPLTAICEGRASTTRAELGVEFDVTPYGQTAIATRLDCALPHAKVARQWFSPLGILAFLPLGGPQGRSVAVVWSAPAESATQWQQADPQAFTDLLGSISNHALGELTLQGPRVAWPLQQATARRWCGLMPQASGHTGSWVLVGDTAHNVHPLAGQGLNLGLADVQALGHILQQRKEWQGTGDLRLLRRYARTRKAALLPLGLAMDGIQQLFTRTEPSLQVLRNWGMNQFERCAPLKHWVTQQAMGLR